MNDSQSKRENRKALPKFLLIVAVSGVVGGLIGFFSAAYGLSDLSPLLETARWAFGWYAAPGLLWATAILLPLIGVMLYRGAKQRLSRWDGEEESTSDAIEQRLSLLLYLSSAATILSFFLITAAYSVADGMTAVRFFGSIAAFIGIMAEAIILQQKSVDAVKTLNPEKTASVYDSHFQKKWLDSCDEAERLIVGKCAWKAYSVTNRLCLALCCLFAVSALIFETSLLPSLAVCLIWLVSQTVYWWESMKYSKAGIRIS